MNYCTRSSVLRIARNCVIEQVGRRIVSGSLQTIEWTLVENSRQGNASMVSQTTSRPHQDILNSCKDISWKTTLRQSRQRTFFYGEVILSLEVNVLNFMPKNSLTMGTPISVQRVQGWGEEPRLPSRKRLTLGKSWRC